MKRRALTLVELLVVIAIVVLLVFVAVPNILPSIESRAIREAARSVNVCLGSARNQAMATGRPCCVFFQRDSVSNQASTTLFFGKAPPPYAGDTTRARVYMQLMGILPDGRTQYRATPEDSDYNSALVSEGDLMQVNGQGPWYVILDPATLTLVINRRPGSLPWSASPSLPVTYKILRRPVMGAATPMQLPSVAAVDLRWSGGTNDLVRADAFRPADDTDTFPVIVVFSPTGSLSSIYCRDAAGIYKGWPVTESIHLLIGLRDRVPTTLNGPSLAEDGLSNWQRAESLWVSVNPQNGMVKTTETAPADDFIDARRFVTSTPTRGAPTR